MGLLFGDTYNISSGPSRVDVHEHKAPTDESLKLLKEMEEKVLKSVIDRFRTPDNFVGEVTVLRTLYGDGAIVHFSLNGKKYQVELGGERFIAADKYSMFKKVYEIFAAELASILLAEAIKDSPSLFK